MALLISPPVWSRAEEWDAGVWVLWYFVFGSGTLWRRGLVGDEMMKVLAAFTHCLWGCTTALTFHRPACAGECSPCLGGFQCARVPPRQSSGLSLRMYVGAGGGVRGAHLSTCVVLNYGARLRFNRSAEELQSPMSQPSCIIAPVCHCHRLARATSDCSSPLSPLFAFYPDPFFPLFPSVFILISLISFCSRGSQRERIGCSGGSRPGLTNCVQRFCLPTSVMSCRCDPSLCRSSPAFLAKWGFLWRIIYDMLKVIQLAADSLSDAG